MLLCVHLKYILGCKYNRSAAWSKCDSRTNLRTKVLKLEAGVNRSGAECEPERRITKNCRGGQPDRAKKSHDHFPQGILLSTLRYYSVALLSFLAKLMIRISGFQTQWWTT